MCFTELVARAGSSDTHLTRSHQEVPGDSFLIVKGLNSLHVAAALVLTRCVSGLGEGDVLHYSLYLLACQLRAVRLLCLTWFSLQDRC